MNDKFANAAAEVIRLRDPDDSTFNKVERVFRDGIELE